MVVVQEVGGSSPLAHPILFTVDPVKDPETPGSFSFFLVPGASTAQEEFQCIAVRLLSRCTVTCQVRGIGPADIYYSRGLRSIISTCLRK